MLGQLFQSLTPSWRKLSRQAPSSDAPDAPLSVTEDAHTRSLLFPDPDMLNRSHSEPYPLQGNTAESVTAAYGAIFDNWNTEVGIDGSQDIRILIARDDLGKLPKTILYDSGAQYTGIERDISGYKTSREPISPRWKSPPGASVNVPSSRQSSGRRTHHRSGSSGLSSLFMPSPDSFGSGSFGRSRLRGSSIDSIPENDIQRIKRDVKDAEEEMDAYMDCMFGSTVPSYRGPSMKMHILPRRKSIIAPFGRSNLRRSVSDLPSTPPNLNLNLDRREPGQNIVLVTRTFSIPISDARPRLNDMKAPQAPHVLNKSASYHNSSPIGAVPITTSTSAQQKVLFYAVSMAIRMTSGTPSVQTSPLQMQRQMSPLSPYSPSGASFQDPNIDSTSKWNTGDGIESVQSDAYLDDFVTEIVTRHWDVISRTLYTLQHEVQGNIIHAHINSPIGRSIDAMQGEEVRNMVKKSISRVADAINTARVATGQGRWGIWRDEAIWIGRWAREQQQDPFYYLLISGFLANHKEWLGLVPEVFYRRRPYRQRNSDRSSENVTLRNRTVIISDDKMTCRRLVFLLSAFLPTYRSYHPTLSSTMSTRALSDVAVRSKNASYGSNEIVTGASIHPKNSFESSGYLSPPSLLSRENSTEQSPQTAGSGNSSLSQGPAIAGLLQTNLTFKKLNERSRRTSAVTVSSIAPGSTVPVPHFAPSSSRRNSELNDPRRDSNESQASAKLLKNLQLTRSHSSTSMAISKAVPHSDSRASGDVVSLNNQLLDMDMHSRPLQRYAGSTSILGSSADSGGRRLQNIYRDIDTDSSVLDSPTSPKRSRIAHGSGPYPISRSSHKNQASIDRPTSSGLPFKMSINEKDGIIDVEIPFNDFGSPLPSPSFGWAEPSSWGSKSHSPLAACIQNPTLELQPLRVAGWLKKYHQDWHLQAVKPYDELEQDIRNSMKAEPTPPNIADPKSSDIALAERWVDICSTIIADCESFKLRRLRLRRLFKYTSTLEQPSIISGANPSSTPKTGLDTTQELSSSATVITQINEEIVEEDLDNADETLVQALDRVLAQSRTSSHPASGKTSRRNSIHENSKDHAADSLAAARPELPRRECERIILGSLEQIVREAIVGLNRDLSASQASRHHEDEDFISFNLHDQVRKWLKELDGLS